jgi:hypothetical protein
VLPTANTVTVTARNPGDEEVAAMTTYAPDDTGRRLEELADREREAWSAYRDNLRDLSGRAYDDAEEHSWEDLQRTLQEVASERAELATAQSAQN